MLSDTTLIAGICIVIILVLLYVYRAKLFGKFMSYPDDLAYLYEPNKYTYPSMFQAQRMYEYIQDGKRTAGVSTEDTQLQDDSMVNKFWQDTVAAMYPTKETAAVASGKIPATVTMSAVSKDTGTTMPAKVPIAPTIIAALKSAVNAAPASTTITPSNSSKSSFYGDPADIDADTKSILEDMKDGDSATKRLSNYPELVLNPHVMREWRRGNPKARRLAIMTANILAKVKNDKVDPYIIELMRYNEDGSPGLLVPYMAGMPSAPVDESLLARVHTNVGWDGNPYDTTLPPI